MKHAMWKKMLVAGLVMLTLSSNSLLAASKGLTPSDKVFVRIKGT